MLPLFCLQFLHDGHKLGMVHSVEIVVEVNIVVHSSHEDRLDRQVVLVNNGSLCFLCEVVDLPTHLIEKRLVQFSFGTETVILMFPKFQK